MAKLSDATKRVLQRMSLGIFGSGPAFFKAAAEDSQALATLLSRGKLPDMLDEQKRTLLIVAAEAGNVESVKLLIQAGASLNDVQQDHRTALAEAADKGHAHCVKALLDAGADWRVADWGRHDPLLFAVREGQAEIANMLLDAGAPWHREPQADNDWGYCALFTACRHVQPECLRVLIEHGADPLLNVNQLAYMHGGPTALHALCAAFGEGFDERSQKCAQMLLASRPDLEARGWLPGMGRSGYTPLLLCAAIGHVDLARLLIEHGADIHARDDEGLDMFDIGIEHQRHEWIAQMRPWLDARTQREQLDATAAQGANRPPKTRM